MHAKVVLSCFLVRIEGGYMDKQKSLNYFSQLSCISYII